VQLFIIYYCFLNINIVNYVCINLLSMYMLMIYYNLNKFIIRYMNEFLMIILFMNLFFMYVYECMNDICMINIYFYYYYFLINIVLL
jgi:hypothetical protein